MPSGEYQPQVDLSMKVDVLLHNASVMMLQTTEKLKMTLARIWNRKKNLLIVKEVLIVYLVSEHDFFLCDQLCSATATCEAKPPKYGRAAVDKYIANIAEPKNPELHKRYWKQSGRKRS